MIVNTSHTAMLGGVEVKSRKYTMMVEKRMISASTRMR